MEFSLLPAFLRQGVFSSNLANDLTLTVFTWLVLKVVLLDCFFASFASFA
jgi:hypothetical protein